MTAPYMMQQASTDWSYGSNSYRKNSSWKHRNWKFV